MKNFQLLLVCLGFCFGNLACSNTDPLFGEEFSQATYEPGSWEIQDNMVPW